MERLQAQANGCESESACRQMPAEPLSEATDCGGASGAYYRIAFHGDSSPPIL
jgi:hypothetical protein